MARYRTLGALGEGGQGVVYVAEQTDLGRRVALKRLRPELAHDTRVVARFFREARICASLAHPNVVTVYESGSDEIGPYIAFELLSGESLEQRVAREGPLPFPLVAEVAEQVLFALEEAHAANVIHRDIKPANVFLTQHRRGLRVKLLDFGVAKGSRSLGSGLTRPGDVVGSLAFMPPEQIADLGVDARTDLYSVGVCLYYMIAGIRPFSGSTTGELLLALDRPPLPLALRRPDVTGELSTFVRKAMAPLQDKRFQSASEMLDGLSAIGIRPYANKVAVATEGDGETSLTAPTLPRSRPQALPGLVHLADLECVTIAMSGELDGGDEEATQVRIPTRSPPASRSQPAPRTEPAPEPGTVTGPTHRRER